MTPSHPLFSDSQDEVWIDISIIDEEIDDHELVSLIKRHQNQVLEAAGNVLSHFLRLPIPSDLSPLVREHNISLRTDGSRGYYCYLELELEDDRASSDRWWVIIACPQPFNFSTPRYNVWRFGWECQ